MNLNFSLLIICFAFLAQNVSAIKKSDVLVKKLRTDFKNDFKIREKRQYFPQSSQNQPNQYGGNGPNPFGNPFPLGAALRVKLLRSV